MQTASLMYRRFLYYGYAIAVERVIVIVCREMAESVSKLNEQYKNNNCIVIVKVNDGVRTV